MSSRVSRRNHIRSDSNLGDADCSFATRLWLAQPFGISVIVNLNDTSPVLHTEGIDNVEKAREVGSPCPKVCASMYETYPEPSRGSCVYGGVHDDDATAALVV